MSQYVMIQWVFFFKFNPILIRPCGLGLATWIIRQGEPFEEKKKLIFLLVRTKTIQTIWNTRYIHFQRKTLLRPIRRDETADENDIDVTSLPAWEGGKRSRAAVKKMGKRKLSSYALWVHLVIQNVWFLKKKRKYVCLHYLREKNIQYMSLWSWGSSEPV